MQTHLPFAVVGSVDDVKIGNKMVKARLYPWGSVQGECAELTGLAFQATLPDRRCVDPNSCN